MPKIVYTTDLHGNLSLYQAAGECAIHRKADALVLGGDLCPGKPSASLSDLPTTQAEFIKRELRPLLETWKQMQPELRILVIPGNDDCQTILPGLNELSELGLLDNIHQAQVMLSDYCFVGLAFVPPTPFSIKDFERWDDREAATSSLPSCRPVVSKPQGFAPLPNFRSYLSSQPTIDEELQRLAVKESGKSILVAHTPPHRTRCDVLHNGQHIGSRAVRRWIELHQPLLTLHGHIHESPRLSGAYHDRIGDTWVVNPGCDHQQPHFVTIDLEDPAGMEHSLLGRL